MIFLHPGADILKMHFPALLEDHQSSRRKQYRLLMRQVDWAQPNSNPGPNRNDGICIVECRARDYSENQKRSSNHQESQNIFFTVIIFVTQHLHLILHSFLFFLHKMTTSHLLVECLLLLPPILMSHVLKKFEGYCIELSRIELINASQKKIVKIRLSLINLKNMDCNPISLFLNYE